MSEIEAAAADGAGAFFRRKPKHALPLGSPCPNCATPLAGAWCHACGQSAEDYHRSLFRLAAEAFEGLFEMDGRLWRTLPNLLFNPAKLTRQYLDGHRAPQAPPFRTFLIVVVLVFLAGGYVGGGKDAVNFDKPRAAHPTTTTPGAKATPAATPAAPAPATATSATAAAAKSGMPDINFGPEGDNNPVVVWLKARGEYAYKHQDAFKSVLSTWAQRLSILALPISAILLGPMFFWKRNVFMFDHLIFSMHSLSFQGLLFSTIMLTEQYSDAIGWLVLASPTHLFFHLRGTYGLSWFGTLIRMFVLFVGSCVAFSLLLVGLLLIGLYEVGP